LARLDDVAVTRLSKVVGVGKGSTAREPSTVAANAVAVLARNGSPGERYRTVVVHGFGAGLASRWWVVDGDWGAAAGVGSKVSAFPANVRYVPLRRTVYLFSPGIDVQLSVIVSSALRTAEQVWPTGGGSSTVIGAPQLVLVRLGRRRRSARFRPRSGSCRCDERCSWSRQGSTSS